MLNGGGCAKTGPRTRRIGTCSPRSMLPNSPMPSDPLPEPWRSFLRDLDTQLAGPTELHSFGGFVVAQCYGLRRPTADIDILESKGTDLITIAKLAGRTSPLYKRHGVYIDVVTVADVPDNYDERLTTARCIIRETSVPHFREARFGSGQDRPKQRQRPRRCRCNCGRARTRYRRASRALHRGAPAKAWQAGTRRPHARALDRDHRGNAEAPAGLKACGYSNPRNDDTSRRRRSRSSNCERRSRSRRDVTSSPDARGIAAVPQPGRCSPPDE